MTLADPKPSSGPGCCSDRLRHRTGLVHVLSRSGMPEGRGGLFSPIPKNEAPHLRCSRWELSKLHIGDPGNQTGKWVNLNATSEEDSACLWDRTCWELSKFCFSERWKKNYSWVSSGGHCRHLPINRKWTNPWLRARADNKQFCTNLRTAWFPPNTRGYFEVVHGSSLAIKKTKN